MRYIPQFLSSRESQQLLNWILNEAPIAWQRERFTIFGKTISAPRRLAWCGDPGVNYRYTGINHVAEGWHPPLALLRERISSAYGGRFNFVLLNRYDRGTDHMGWHFDDESALQPNIASLSLGHPRRFRFRDGPGQPASAIDLAHGSLILLDGRKQHMLAKTCRAVGVRVNLTFRNVDAMA